MPTAATAQPQRTARRRRPSTQNRRSGADDATTPDVSTNDNGAAATAAAAAAGTAAATAPDPNAPQFNPRTALREFVFRTLLMYGMFQLFMKPKNAAPPSAEDQAAAVLASPTPTPVANRLLASLGVDMPTNGPTPPYYKRQLSCHWKSGDALSLRVFTSLKANMTFAEAAALPVDRAVYARSGLTLDTSSHNYHASNVTLDVPDEVALGNTSWYAHAFVVRGNMWELDPQTFSEAAVNENVLYDKYNIITWLDEGANKDLKSLLGGNDADNSTKPADAKSEEEQSTPKAEKLDGDTEEKDDKKITQMWRPTIPIVLVTTTSPVVLAQMPPNSAQLYRVSLPHKSFFPPMHIDDFWTLDSALSPMNATVKTTRIEMSFTPISLYKWSFYRQFENVWQKQMDFGAIRKKEIDELKRMFVETNPVLLGTTMAVSMVHTVLEGLAFRNDISHWKNIKTMEGVSVRSMMWKIVMEAIIFLYLWDNDTSWMITIGNGVGLAIEVWKLTKAVKFENFGKKKLLGFIPWFEMTDRESYSKETKEYDEQAMKYLSYAVYPLVAGYALYSLRYEKHKSWYSWIINSLVGAVYAFGFIMMFPQIFINYKLKSVAHIPMKAMMYKTLNTIIDDLFSFIIKMPWLHRLACFRDDVVFLVILYQRWIYPVDNTRVNEFGQRFDADGNEIVEEDKDTKNIGGQTVATVAGRKKSKKTGAATKKSDTSGSAASSVGSESSSGQEAKSRQEKKND